LKIEICTINSGPFQTKHRVYPKYS